MTKTMLISLKRYYTIWRKIGRKFSFPSYLYISLLSAATGNLLRLLRNNYSTHKLAFKIRFKDGLILYFPARDIKRFFNLFSNLPSQSYLNAYKRFFGSSIDFQEGDWLIDIGAHIGRFCVPIFNSCPGIFVAAYEPDPVSFNCLAKSSFVNNFQKGRFKVFNYAVYKKSGRMLFSVGEETTLGSLKDVSFSSNKKKKQNDIKVKTVTMKDIFAVNKIKKCKLVKMDCEGSEYAILKSLPKKNFAKIENFIIEVHPALGHRQNEIRKLLKKKGFLVKEKQLEHGFLELYARRIV